jgi:hypothetical protein
VHPAALPANIIEGDSRVLLYPAEPASNANARRGDCGTFFAMAALWLAARGEIGLTR